MDVFMIEVDAKNCETISLRGSDNGHLGLGEHRKWHNPSMRLRFSLPWAA